jgi:hypothetical protein
MEREEIRVARIVADLSNEELSDGLKALAEDYRKNILDDPNRIPVFVTLEEAARRLSNGTV